MGYGTRNLKGFVSTVKPVKTINMELNHLITEENSTPVSSQVTSGQPLVSVIVPAYNAEAYIAYTLDSVLSQTYKNIEVIVVDDGSRDGTAQIVKEIAQRDGRVTLLRQSNSGVAAARNLAIEKSRGEFIAPIDADDIWYPRKIEKQVCCMLHEGQSTGLVYVWSVHIDGRGLLAGGYSASDIEGDVFVALIMSNFVGNASAPLISRVCFEQVGGYSTRLLEQNAQGCEDRDLYLRIAASYKFRVVKEFLVGYRKVNNSMSLNYRSMEKSQLIVMEDVRQRHPNIPPFIYRWSWGHYCLYLGGQSAFCGHYGKSILYLCKGAWTSPVFLLYPGFYWFLCGGVLRLVKKMIARVFRAMFCPSAQIGEKDCSNHKEVTLSDIIIRSSQPQNGLSKLHRVRLERIRRLFTK